MAKSALFGEVKNIEDFKDVIEENIDEICNKHSNFMNKEAVEKALQGIPTFPKDQESKFVSFLKRVDRAFYSPGLYNKNSYHKFPVALSGLIYYNYYPETISGLTLDETVLLASFSFVEPVEFYETSVEKYGKEMLSTIIEKTGNDTYDDMSLLSLADRKMRKNNFTKEEATEYIKTQPLEHLLAEEEKVTAELMDKVRLPW